jgi:hypothetical protein
VALDHKKGQMNKD